MNDKDKNKVKAVHTSEFFYLTSSVFFLTIYVIFNHTTMQRIPPLLRQELESLGISIKYMHDLNDDKELENLTDNLKREFLKEINEMKKKGFFVNPGGG